MRFVTLLCGAVGLILCIESNPLSANLRMRLAVIEPMPGISNVWKTGGSEPTIGYSSLDRPPASERKILVNRCDQLLAGDQPFAGIHS